jgi:hypothetical protein
MSIIPPDHFKFLNLLEISEIMIDGINVRIT